MAIISNFLTNPQVALHFPSYGITLQTKLLADPGCRGIFAWDLTSTALRLVEGIQEKLLQLEMPSHGSLLNEPENESLARSKQQQDVKLE